MQKKIKILLIEDLQEDIVFTKIQLNKSFGDAYTFHTTDYFSKAIQLLKENTFDIILLDLCLPDSKGLNTFRTLVDSCNAPVIIYSGLGEKSIMEDALKYGAQDYLIKGKTTDNMLKQSIVKGIENYNLVKSVE
jgi:DNA-binding response OmpR family regulator